MGLLSGPFLFFGPDPLGLCWFFFFFLFPLLAKPRGWDLQGFKETPCQQEPTASHPSPSHFVDAWLRISRFLLITSETSLARLGLTVLAKLNMLCTYVRCMLCVLVLLPSVRPMSRWGFFGVQLGGRAGLLPYHSSMSLFPSSIVFLSCCCIDLTRGGLINQSHVVTF